MLEAGVLDGFLADLRATHTAFTALVGLIECADDRVMDTLERLQAAQAAA
jgi:hypothetical protein